MNYIENLLKGQKVEWKTLGEVCNVLRGKRLTKKELVENGEYPVFHGGLIPLGCYDKFNRKANQTMVINTGSVGEVVWSDVDFWSSDGTFVIETNNLIDDKFLYHFLKTKENDFKNQKREGGVPTIERGVIERLQIPLPPLAVQQEIAKVLDKFCELEKELKKELKKELELRKKQYEYYRNNLLSFNEIWGSKSLIINNLQWKTLGEIGEFVRGTGLQKKDFTQTGVPAIHYGQIYTKYGNSVTETISFVSEELAKKLRKASKNDLIIAGVSENVEDLCKCVVWKGDEGVCVSGDTFIFKHSQNADYIGHLLRTDDFLNYKKKYAVGAKVTRLQAGKLPEYKIPLPPLEEQKRIAEILDKFDALVNDISQGLPAEIIARRKQYEYYREQIINV